MNISSIFITGWALMLASLGYSLITNPEDYKNISSFDDISYLDEQNSRLDEAKEVSKNIVYLLAYNESSEAIKELLYSPETATFPTTDIKFYHISSIGDKYLIKSWVDSKNESGVLVRNYFTAIVNCDESLCEVSIEKFE